MCGWDGSVGVGILWDSWEFGQEEDKMFHVGSGAVRGGCLVVVHTVYFEIEERATNCCLVTATRNGSKDTPLHETVG